MREIKFRWYDKKTNRIYNNSETVIYPDGSIGNDNDSDHNVLAGQFIGIKDRCNVDIYEGDILSRIEKSCDGYSYLAIYKVIFKDFYFCFEVVKSEILKSGAIVSFADNFMVMGNIYESPEMMDITVKNISYS